MLYFSGGIQRNGIENQASLPVGYQCGGAFESLDLCGRHAWLASHLAAGGRLDWKPARIRWL